MSLESPPQVCIRVADDGAGIDPKDLPHIFDPFFTAGKGTGLGLSIVQQIVKGHGGTIAAESQPEGGTAFTITLPGSWRDDRADAARFHRQLLKRQTFLMQAKRLLPGSSFTENKTRGLLH